MRVKPGQLVASAALTLLLPTGPTQGSEGGSSLYLPGLAGDVLIAIPPEPGLALADSIYLERGSVGTAVLQGAVNVGLDLDIALNIVGGSYTFETPVLGGTYTVGAAVPFGYVELDTTLVDKGGGKRSASADTFDLADIAVTPLQLNWISGDFSFRFAEVVIAPVGAYDVDEVVNLGRNYWGFDTVGAITYFNQKSSTEASIAPGILVNTRNSDTNYKTGAEFHLDFTANQFLSETFALGVRGFYYHQVSGDSGSGALLGDFKGEAFGLGPGAVWIPKFADGKLAVVGKWMTNVHTENRFDSDYVTLTGAWTF